MRLAGAILVLAVIAWRVFRQSDAPTEGDEETMSTQWLKENVYREGAEGYKE